MTLGAKQGTSRRKAGVKDVIRAAADEIGVTDPVSLDGATTPTLDGATRVTEAELRRLIQQAAYYKAEARGFAPGYELQDWIEAEAEVRRELERADGAPQT
jgi:hypothetical protein